MCKKKSASNYILKDRTRGRGIITKDWPGHDNGHWIADHHNDEDNIWDDEEDHNLVTPHWGTQEAWDYFANEHDFKGFTKKGPHKIRIWANWVHRDELGNENPDQASYSNYKAKLDHIDVGEDMAELNVIAHEFMHGIQFHHRKTNKGKSLEAETLSESYSDMFGIVVENYVFGSSDWIINQFNQVPARNLRQPLLTNQPQEYQGTNWGFDPHINTGVTNRWFAGVTGALGIEGAASLVLKVIREYAQNSWDFQDMRKATYMAAVEIYGPCSWETGQINSNWDAVNVTANHEIIACPGASFQIYGPTIICEEEFGNGEFYSFTVPNTFTSSLNWTVPSHWTYYEQGNSLILTDIDLPETTTFPHDETIYVSTEGESTVELDIIFEDCEHDGITKSPPVYKPGKDLPNNDILVFPNPTTGIFQVNFAKDTNIENYSLKVVDLAGIEVFSKEKLQKIDEYNPQVESGIYFVQVFDRQYLIMSTKLVVTK